MNLLLTGSTGALGAELLGCLAARQPSDRIYVLLRAETPGEFAARAWNLAGTLDADVRHRVTPLHGDVTADRLGFGDRYCAIAGEIDEIYHAAACTRFDAGIEEAASHNIGGTRRVLDLARASRRLGRSGRLHFVSTAYVAGRRAGAVNEDDLDCGQQFFNAYEWSKFRAECDVRDASSDLPVTIYRPSVVVGNSQTGWARRFLGVYQVLRWIDRGQLTTLPCRADFELDIVPADYVAEAIVTLAGRSESVGKTFHLTAGNGNRLALEELIGIFLHERETRGREPRTIDGVRFEAAHPSPSSRRLDPYLPYLTCPKAFDDGNARAMLNGFGAAPCREFFPRVVRYALDSEFRA
jgi:thioester reductase-like protein